MFYLGGSEMDTGVRESNFVRWYRGVRPPVRSWGEDPSDLDFATLSRVLRFLRYLYGPSGTYFRTVFSGWDRVPDGPCLVVSNHSGGTSVPDAWGFGLGWYDRFGFVRPLHGLAHEMVFAFSGCGGPFARMGMVRADRSLALEVLRDWRRDLWVFPGGDVDTWRPHRDRFRVRFAGRKGYVRLALQAGVPIVPVACAGAHDTLVVLTDGRRLAEKLHFREAFRAGIFPVHLSFPFGLTVGPWPHLPPPATFRYRFAPPVLAPKLDPGEEPSRALVDEIDAAVQTTMQAELDILARESASKPWRKVVALRDVVGRRLSADRSRRRRS